MNEVISLFPHPPFFFIVFYISLCYVLFLIFFDVFVFFVIFFFFSSFFLLLVFFFFVLFFQFYLLRSLLLPLNGTSRLTRNGKPLQRREARSFSLNPTSALQDSHSCEISFLPGEGEVPPPFSLVSFSTFSSSVIDLQCL